MPKFISIDKMKKLREAARNGDEKAKKILIMQLDDKEDFEPLMNEYFTPQPQEPELTVVDGESQEIVKKPNSRLEQFLLDNKIDENSSDYNEAVEEFYTEFPNERPTEQQEEPTCEYKELIKKEMKEESDAIDSYSKAITSIMNSEELNDNKKRKIISRLKEIRSDEEEHFRELNDLLKIDDSSDEEIAETDE